MPTIRWRQWSERAFADAATANTPVLLSIVTAWSEECAAMDATTYGHPDVVAIIHERFIPIRVDADRRPDVSERYNLGGWPTTACLTPDGAVLSGGTYVGAEQMIALLNQVADAWRDRAPEIRERVRRVHLQADPGVRLKPDTTPDAAAVDWFRALLLEEFDATHGGFGSGSKYPHAPAMRLALAVAGEDADEAMRQIAEVTLERMGALWDPANGGFYRYADASDWGRPGTEKTLEDNAALLGVYLDAAIRLQSDDYRDRAAELVRWVKGTLADEAGGFYNAQAAVSRVVDRSMYVDRNADMIAALLRAAALFEDPWLRDFALKSLETVILPGYAPGAGVAHVGNKDDPEGVRGLLGDQIRVASALIWAHVITEQLPYSMLALELVQFAVRAMWDAQAGCFRDRASGVFPVHPFALNCEAACVLNRLATLTGDQTHYDRAVAILGFFASDYRRHGLFGAPYALATREVIDRRVPLGLELSPVDWHLDKDLGPRT